MTKQKTRKELEEERLSWKFWALAWGIIFIITFIGLFVIGINGKRLETQLSECQEQVFELESCSFSYECIVWDYKYKCIAWESNKENCEVLE